MRAVNDAGVRSLAYGDGIVVVLWRFWSRLGIACVAFVRKPLFMLLMACFV